MIQFYYDGKALDHVKCPKPYFPPIPVKQCTQCYHYNGMKVFTDDDRPPFVHCRFTGKTVFCEMVP